MDHNTNKNYRIGVLTFSPNSINPGTIFQAWSLCHFIDSISGFEAELIFYECWNRKIISHGKLSLANLWFNYTLWRTGQFQKSIKKYPNKKALVKDNVKSINGRYDMIVVGSDQVWNPELTGYDKTFFLDFVENVKKGAYAPSIGIPDWPEGIKHEIKDFLKDFQFIGVREKQAVPVVQALTEKPVHWSLDPTFLVNKSEWKNVALPPKERKDGYIMEYCIIKSNLALVQVIEKASKQLKVPVIECYGGRKRVPIAKKKYNVGADGWLGYILNSKLVITDSFHAVAFAINNNKPFYAILSSNGNRITSILELVGLQDRVVTSEDDIDFTKEIDWDPVNQKLEEVRKENQTWLKESLFEALKDKKI